MNASAWTAALSSQRASAVNTSPVLAGRPYTQVMGIVTTTTTTLDATGMEVIAAAARARVNNLASATTAYAWIATLSRVMNVSTHSRTCARRKAGRAMGTVT